MTVDIPLEIAETMDCILSNWCGERSIKDCLNCNFITKDGRCFLPILHEEIIRAGRNSTA